MRKPAGKSWIGIWIARVVSLTFFGLAICALAACRLAGPPPREYVLGKMAEPTVSSIPETGRPLLEVKRVQIPEYLDRTSILERRGNQLVPSSTSRWSERLSVGMTRALVASLAGDLPAMLVTATPPPIGRPTRQIIVEVIAFESRSDQRVILVAHWTIVDGVSRQILTSQQTSLVEVIAGAGDEAVVTAMSRAVEGLAGQVAAGVEGDSRRGG